MFRRYLAERGRAADPELADAAERRLAAAMRGPTKKENVHVEFSKKDAFASIDAAIETLAKVEFPDRDPATAVAKFLDTDAGRELYRLRDVAYSVRESGVEFAKLAADAALEAEAARIRKADPKLSAEAAYCRALEARPELYDLYLSGSAE